MAQITALPCDWFIEFAKFLTAADKAQIQRSINMSAIILCAICIKDNDDAKIRFFSGIAKVVVEGWFLLDQVDRFIGVCQTCCNCC